MHSSGAVQATPASDPAHARHGMGARLIFQLEPSHTSASGFVPLRDDPTATQAAAEVQATPRSALPPLPFGLGVDWRVQVVPFHVTAIVRWAPASVTQPSQGAVRQWIAELIDTRLIVRLRPSVGGSQAAHDHQRPY